MIPLRCLRKNGQRFAGIIAGQHIDIKGGEAQTFPTEIAEALLAKRDNNDNPFFERVDFDATEIHEALGLQVTWKQWPSS